MTPAKLTEADVQRVIDESVNPRLMQDNGCAVLTGIDNGVVTVRMEGMCANCPHVHASFDGIVVKGIRSALPQVKDVLLDDADDAELLAFAKSILRGGRERNGQ